MGRWYNVYVDGKYYWTTKKLKQARAIARTIESGKNKYLKGKCEIFCACRYKVK